MELLSLVYRQYRLAFIAITLLQPAECCQQDEASLPSSINHLSDQSGIRCRSWVSLSALSLLLLVITLGGSPTGLTTWIHHFVYRLRGRLLKQLLDTGLSPRLRQNGAGAAPGLPFQRHRSITIAFVRLPELVQGPWCSPLGSIIYLGLLSPRLLGVTALWVTVTGKFGGLAAGEPGLSPPGMHMRPGRTGSAGGPSSSPGARAGARPRACPPSPPAL